MGQQASVVPSLVLGLLTAGVAVAVMSRAHGRTGGCARLGVRALGALLTVVLTGATGFLGLILAWLLAYNNCEDGCRSGSPFALGAWGTTVELWCLFIPALVMAAVVVVTITAGWRRGAQAAWIAMTTLFVAWSAFTMLIAWPLGLLGLVIACGGALLGVRIAFPRAPHAGRPARPQCSSTA